MKVFVITDSVDAFAFIAKHKIKKKEKYVVKISSGKLVSLKILSKKQG